MGEMSTILLAAQGASAVSGMMGSYNQAQAIRAQGSYEKSQYNLNAQMANLQAEDAINRSDREANLQSYKTKRLMGAQRAALAANGVDVNAGSALDLQEDTAAMGAVDAETIRRNGIMESLGFKMQSASDVSSGRMAQLGARNAARNTLLSGGLNAAREIGQGGYMYSRMRIPSQAGTPLYADQG